MRTALVETSVVIAFVAGTNNSRSHCKINPPRVSRSSKNNRCQWQHWSSRCKGDVSVTMGSKRSVRQSVPIGRDLQWWLIECSVFRGETNGSPTGECLICLTRKKDLMSKRDVSFHYQWSLPVFIFHTQSPSFEGEGGFCNPQQVYRVRIPSVLSQLKVYTGEISIWALFI